MRRSLVKPIANCAHCKAEYRAPRKSSQYCSRACADLGNVAKLTALRHANKGAAACVGCGAVFKRNAVLKQYCTMACRQATLAIKRPTWVPTTTECTMCSKSFQYIGRPVRKLCSEECRRESARRHRAAFARKRPEQLEVYRETQRAKKKRDTLLGRLWRKYPWLPRACESCGESRVLDVAHRPGQERRGLWISVTGSHPDRIWILCPTCHALLDRCKLTQAELGITDRVAPPDMLAVFAESLRPAMAEAAE